MIQRHHNGRQGGMRSSHLVHQINSAFVEPFYGLTSADGRSWGRFGTLLNVAETIQSHSPRTLSFLGQNGLVGSRPGQDDESGDDESGDDEMMRAAPPNARHDRGRERNLATCASMAVPSMSIGIGSRSGVRFTALRSRARRRPARSAASFRCRLAQMQSL